MTGDSRRYVYRVTVEAEPRTEPCHNRASGAEPAGSPPEVVTEAADTEAPATLAMVAEVVVAEVVVAEVAVVAAVRGAVAHQARAPHGSGAPHSCCGAVLVTVLPPAPRPGRDAAARRPAEQRARIRSWLDDSAQLLQAYGLDDTGDEPGAEPPREERT